MAFIFISRSNVHARYYKKLIKQLSFNCTLHIMGVPRLGALKYLKIASQVDFNKVIANQLLRKQARNSLWSNAVIIKVYTMFMLCVERCRFAKYYDLLKSESPEALVIWNGNKLPNITVCMAAKQLGLTTYFYENGLLPGTTSLDPSGINYAASLPRNSQFYLNFDKANQLPFSAPELIPRINHKKRCQFDAIELPERYLFVPFQVPHDTQIACYSPWLKSMEALYDAVVASVRELADPNLKVVFKEHPSWHKHYAHLYDKDDVAIFANGNCTRELINGAEAVITINSTVGLESLLLDKQVITLGLACYNIDELVLHASDQATLIKSLEKLQNGWQANSIVRDKFFTYLKHVYCLPGVWKECTTEHVEAVEKRLTQQDTFVQLSQKES
ncbi:capsular polysaccharide export protein, LipB/KpsS family [Pseudoalteromonas sp. SYSU M81236]|jgi:capsular polysaccharide export protein|uniref:capsular polysaccharide export protein, LipB/KpsS family n=2 Tax=Pseudoalteromonas TaxID=53246 RepID=UPI000C654CB8|nr:capsular biosynthesis protein [Pseudoalteromonas sp.]|tara:strand:+ start:20027 stop:21190 length:1164 start_codon:yes stop_codon:yes gene_type:complete